MRPARRRSRRSRRSSFRRASNPVRLRVRPTFRTGTLAAPVSIPFVSDLVGGLGHIVVPVSLNDKPATLVFDSGGANFLVPDAARSLGLQASGGIATGGAGTQQQMTAYAHVASVDFGGARLSDQNFVVTPLSLSAVASAQRPRDRRPDRLRISRQLPG